MRQFNIGLLASTALVAATVGAPACAQSLTWTDGADAEANWSRAANWSTGQAPVTRDSLIFSSAGSASSANDLVGLTLDTITFDATASLMHLGGNAINLWGDATDANIGMVHNNPNDNYIDLDVNLSFSQTWNINAGTLTMNGDVTGGKALTKSGAGTLQLAGDLADLSSAAVTGGTLQLGHSHVLPNTFDLSISSGASFDVAGFFERIDALSGSGSVKLGSGGLTVGMNDGSGTFTGVINGTGAFAKSGTGTLTLSGANTYTGDTSINAGTLELGANNVLDNATDVTVEAGATFDLNGHTDRIDGLSGAGAVMLGDGGIRVGASNGSSTFSGVISGTGTLTKVGSGTLTLSGANTYTGDTDINGGTLRLGADNVLADTTDVTMAAGTTFSLNGHIETIGTLSGSGTVDIENSALTVGSGEFTGTIGGAGSLTKTGTGTLILEGSNSYTGFTFVNAGELRLGANNAVDGPVAVNGGTLELQGYDQSINATLSMGSGAISGSGTSTITATGYFFVDGTVSARLGDAAAGSKLDKSGDGIVVLLDNNSYSGGTLLSGGTLSVSAENNLGTGALTFNGGTLQTTASFASSRVTTLNAGGGTYDVGSATILTLDSNLTGSGALTKTGAGTLLLNGDNTFSGLTIVKAGTLQFGDGNALTGALTVAGGTVDLQAFNEAVGAVTLTSGSIVGAGTLTGSSYTVEKGTISAVLAGSGALTKNGTGTVILLGANSYTGATTVNEGTLKGDSTSLHGNIANNAHVAFDQDFSGTYAGVISGTGGLSKYGSGTLTLTGANTYKHGTDVFEGAIALGGNERLANSGALTLWGGTFDLGGFSETIGAVTLNGGSIIGEGTLTAASYSIWDATISAQLVGTGAVTKIGGGTLLLGNNERLSDTAALTIEDGKVDLATFNETVGALKLVSGLISGSGTLTASSIEVQDGTISVKLTGEAALTKTGSGTVILSKASSYTGGTTIGGGELQIIGNQRLADTGALTVAGGTLDLDDYNETVGAVTLTSGLISGTGKLTGSSYMVESGLITANLGGAGALTKNGAGTVQLTGDNSYSGGTTVNGGVLQGSVGALQGDIRNNAAVVLSHSFPALEDFNAVISGTGSLTKIGSASAVVTGAHTYTGGTIINGGGLYLGANERFADSGALTITFGTFNLQTFDETVGAVTVTSGAIQGTGTLTGSSFQVGSGVINAKLAGGALTKTGTGTMILGGANTYSGGTTVNDGVLRIGASERLSDDGALTVAGGTFALQGFDETVGALTLTSGQIIGLGTLTASSYAVESGAVSAKLGGTGALKKTGGNTVTLSNANTYTGRTTVDAGTLALTGAGAIDASVALDVGADGMFDASGKSGTYLYAGDVRNQGVIKGGLGDNVFEMSGDVSGAGDYLGNVLFTGAVAPGNSPALVEMDNATFGAGSVLTMELGGLTRGLEYDAINADRMTFDQGSTIRIALLGPSFVPALGDFFDLFVASTALTINASFDFTDAVLTNGMRWSTALFLGNEGSKIFRVSVIAGMTGGGGGDDVPAPGSLALILAGLLVMGGVQRTLTRSRAPRARIRPTGGRRFA